jgi:hypothetical protein
MTIDTGYVNYAAAAACKIDQWARVELGRHGGIYGDAPAGTQMKVAISVIGDELTGAGALGGSDGPTAGAQLLPKCLAIGQ